MIHNLFIGVKRPTSQQRVRGQECDCRHLAVVQPDGRCTPGAACYQSTPGCSQCHTRWHGQHPASTSTAEKEAGEDMREERRTGRKRKRESELMDFLKKTERGLGEGGGEGEGSGRQGS